MDRQATRDTGSHRMGGKWDGRTRGGDAQSGGALLRVALLALGLLTAAALPGAATQTDNRGMHAVPPPGKVVIDGKLNDWDLSGQILICYDLETLQDVYSGRAAMMYDAENLYVALHWKDATPMGNSHHPHFQGTRGWAGDCLQLRVKTDRITHVTAWYHAESGQPVINLDYGKSLGEPFGGGDAMLYQTEGWKLGQGAEMGFLKDADGKGYVQELKLPWKTITLGKPYRAGDSFRCGIELLWGEVDWPVHRYADNLDPAADNREFFWTAHNAWGPVALEALGNLKLPEPAYLSALRGEELVGPVEISYRLPKDARVTIAINDAQGRRVRNLIAALPRKAGGNVERWDGRDDEGKLVPPGEYRYTGLYHDGVRVNYVMAYGNPGNPPWDVPTGRGAFYSDHTPPWLAAAAGEYVVLGCPLAEAGRAIIGVDLQGQRLWGLQSRAYGKTTALATDGKLVYVAGVEPADGKWERGKLFLWRCELANGRLAPWESKDAQGQPVMDLPLLSDTPADTCVALSLREGKLAVLLAEQRRLLVLDAKTGAELSRREDLPADLRGGAWTKEGALVVAAGGKLLRLNPEGGEARTLAEGLEEPAGVAVAPEGTIYVSQRGTRQDVAVFSAEGKLLREIGKRGGRPHHGKFDAQAMLKPGKLALDSQGRLWVPEENMNPKRTSVWSAEGKLLLDLVGTTTYAGAGVLNPDDPSMAFSDDTVYRVDLKKGTWAPVYSLAQSDHPDDVFVPGVDSHAQIITRAGVTYLYNSDRTGVVKCLMRRPDGEWRMCAALGIVLPKPDTYFKTRFDHPLLKSHAGEAFVWADRNGDGLVQAMELKFGAPSLEGKPLQLKGTYWGVYPDREGTVLFTDPQAQALIRLPITGYTPCGAPLYRMEQAVVQKADRPMFSNTAAIWGGTRGRVYLNESPLSALDGQGRTLFTYPSRHVSVHGSHTASAARPGYLIGPSSILGTADFGGQIGEIFALNGNLGENYLFTADGLWVQSLFKDCRGQYEVPGEAVRGMPMDGITGGGESFGGDFCRTKDGRVYLIIGGTEARVLQLSGLETIRRLSGKISYSAAQYAEAQKLLQEQAAQAAEGKLYVVRRAATPPVVDGKVNDWPMLMDEALPAAEIRDKQIRYGRVAASYDQEKLYLAWRAWAPTGQPRNAGQDGRLLFKTGDCVDLMLGPAEAKAGAGNLRLLIAPLQGKLTAVVYRAVVPGTAEAERVRFASPWRATYFDQVQTVSEVTLASGPVGGGYVVEAAVPWSVLGVTPQAGLKLRGDFGVLAADSGGTVTVSRQYWSNKATGLVNDVPGEAELTPQLWGELGLE